MRVARMTEIRKLEVINEEFNGKPGAGQAVVRVKAVGICGTDLHIFKEGRADVQLPRVMGHELSGEVVEIGPGVENVQPGDRVCMDPVISCGHCALCESGHPNICAEVKCYGVQVDGGYQDYIVVDAAKLYRFPDKLSYVEAALAEPFSVAAQILSRANLQAGEKLVVIGAGTIGLCVAQAAKGLGAQVLISDVVDAKLELARSFSCDAIVNSKKEDLEDAVRAFAPKYIDVIIDCVGAVPLLEQTIAMATPMTRIVCIGFDGREARLYPVNVTKKELTIVGSRMNALKFPMVMDWMENDVVNPATMVSAEFPVEEIQQAFEYALSHPESIKTIIRFDD